MKKGFDGITSPPFPLCYLLDHLDVGLHIVHVAIPPVILEAYHQSIGPQTTQSRCLWETLGAEREYKKKLIENPLDPFHMLLHQIKQITFEA